MVDPGITIFPKPTKDKSSRKPSNEDSASHEDIGFQENGDQTKVSETRSLASSHQGENLIKDAVPSQCEADAVRALDHEKQVLSAINSQTWRLRLPRGIPIIFWRVHVRF